MKKAPSSSRKDPKGSPLSNLKGSPNPSKKTSNKPSSSSKIDTSVKSSPPAKSSSSGRNAKSSPPDEKSKKDKKSVLPAMKSTLKRLNGKDSITTEDLEPIMGELEPIIEDFDGVSDIAKMESEVIHIDTSDSEDIFAWPGTLNVPSDIAMQGSTVNGLSTINNTNARNTPHLQGTPHLEGTPNLNDEEEEDLYHAIVGTIGNGKAYTVQEAKSNLLSHASSNSSRVSDNLNEAIIFEDSMMNSGFISSMDGFVDEIETDGIIDKNGGGVIEGDEDMLGTGIFNDDINDTDDNDDDIKRDLEDLGHDMEDLLGIRTFGASDSEDEFLFNQAGWDAYLENDLEDQVDDLEYVEELEEGNEESKNQNNSDFNPKSTTPYRTKIVTNLYHKIWHCRWEIRMEALIRKAQSSLYRDVVKALLEEEEDRIPIIHCSFLDDRMEDLRRIEFLVKKVKNVMEELSLVVDNKADEKQEAQEEMPKTLQLKGPSLLSTTTTKNHTKYTFFYLNRNVSSVDTLLSMMKREFRGSYAGQRILQHFCSEPYDIVPHSKGSINSINCPVRETITDVLVVYCSLKNDSSKDADSVAHLLSEFTELCYEIQRKSYATQCIAKVQFKIIYAPSSVKPMVSNWRLFPTAWLRSDIAVIKERKEYICKSRHVDSSDSQSTSLDSQSTLMKRVLSVKGEQQRNSQQGNSTRQLTVLEKEKKLDETYSSWFTVSVEGRENLMYRILQFLQTDILTPIIIPPDTLKLWESECMQKNYDVCLLRNWISDWLWQTLEAKMGSSYSVLMLPSFVSSEGGTDNSGGGTVCTVSGGTDSESTIQSSVINQLGNQVISLFEPMISVEKTILECYSSYLISPVSQKKTISSKSTTGSNKNEGNETMKGLVNETCCEIPDSIENNYLHIDENIVLEIVGDWWSKDKTKNSIFEPMINPIYSLIEIGTKEMEDSSSPSMAAGVPSNDILNLKQKILDTIETQILEKCSLINGQVERSCNRIRAIALELIELEKAKEKKEEKGKPKKEKKAKKEARKSQRESIVKKTEADRATKIAGEQMQEVEQVRTIEAMLAEKTFHMTFVNQIGIMVKSLTKDSSNSDKSPSAKSSGSSESDEISYEDRSNAFKKSLLVEMLSIPKKLTQLKANLKHLYQWRIDMLYSWHSFFLPKDAQFSQDTPKDLFESVNKLMSFFIPQHYCCQQGGSPLTKQHDWWMEDTEDTTVSSKTSKNLQQNSRAKLNWNPSSESKREGSKKYKLRLSPELLESLNRILVVEKETFGACIDVQEVCSIYINEYIEPCIYQAKPGANTRLSEDKSGELTSLPFRPLHVFLGNDVFVGDHIEFHDGRFDKLESAGEATSTIIKSKKRPNPELTKVELSDDEIEVEKLCCATSSITTKDVHVTDVHVTDESLSIQRVRPCSVTEFRMQMSDSRGPMGDGYRAYELTGATYEWAKFFESNSATGNSLANANIHLTYPFRMLASAPNVSSGDAGAAGSSGSNRTASVGRLETASSTHRNAINKSVVGSVMGLMKTGILEDNIKNKAKPNLRKRLTKNTFGRVWYVKRRVHKKIKR